MIKRKLWLIPDNTGRRPWFFSQREACFYNVEVPDLDLEAYDAATDDEKNMLLQRKSILVKYDKNLLVIERIPLGAIDEDLRRIHQNDLPNERIESVFIHEEIVISTDRNHIYVMNTEGKILRKTERPAELLEDLESQFASNFFKTKTGKIMILTKGTHHRVGDPGNRYILGISETEKTSFLDPLFFRTRYLQATYSAKKNDIFPHGMTLENLGRMPNILEYVEEIEKDRTQIYRTRVSSLQPIQIIDLTSDTLLVSAFTDGRMKSSSPDKDTPFYFFLIDKETGEIGDEIAPFDTSIYKERQYMLVEDECNDRVLFKTQKAIYEISKTGVLKLVLSLEARTFAKFRRMALLGCIGKLVYVNFYEKGEIYGFELGNSADEMDLNIRTFLKDLKKA